MVLSLKSPASASNHSSVASQSPNPVYHHLGDHDPADDVNEQGPTIGTTALEVLEQGSRSTANDNYHLSPFQLQQRKYAVALLSACTVLLFADQNLMSPNLTAIAADFGFNDQQRDSLLGGHIALAFFVVGAPASFVIGCWADRSHHRTRLFAATVFLGEGACLATYWVRTYPQLYACRAVTGISVGGALPLIYSLLGDMFAAEERHAVSSHVGIGVGIGITVGQGVAGFVGPLYGWRLPFLLISIPALICAAVFWAVVQDPERGGMEAAVRNQRELVRQQQQQQHHQQQQRCCAAALSTQDKCIEMPQLDHGVCCHQERDTQQQQPEYNGDNDSNSNDSHSDDEIVSTSRQSRGFDCQSQWHAFQTLLSTPTLVLTVLQGAPGCVPWGIVNTFLNDYLAVDRGMSVPRATLVVMIFGAGNFFGMLAGGYGGGWLYRRDCRYPSLLAGCAAVVGCVPFYVMINGVTATSRLVWYGPVTLLAGCCSGITGPIVKTTMQNVSMPQTRGTALALFNTFDDFGRGLGPVFVAVLIQKLGGRTPAFNWGVLGWVLCGLLNGITFFTIRQDEERVQTLMAERLPSSSLAHRTDSSTERETISFVADAPMIPLSRRGNSSSSLSSPLSIVTVRQRSRDPC